MKAEQARGLSTPKLVIAVAVLALGAAGIVHATLLDGPDLINPPAVIADDTPGATNNRQQAFDERQAVTLTGDVQCSNGIVSAGEVVNSHMIFFNTPGVGLETDANRTWTFADEIICVMAERSGLYQGITDGVFGAPGTQYPGPFTSRGLETDGTDVYSVHGDQITITMTAEEPGDWIRVLTKVTVPPDTTPPTVFCEASTNPAGKSNEDKSQGKAGEQGMFFSLIGADDTDGAVDLYLTDTESGVEFGPFVPGTQVKIIQAKGVSPSQEPAAGGTDYTIKVNGGTTISATDKAGNEGTAVCSNAR